MISHFIQHDKISLYEITSEDYEFYNLIYTDQRLMKYVSEPLEASKVVNSFKKMIEQTHLNPPQQLMFCITKNNQSIDETSTELSKMASKTAIKMSSKIGIIGLRWNQKSQKTVEIGIIISHENQSKGYGHTAKKMLLSYAFSQLNVKSVVAYCQKNNVIANNANKKLGFKKIKTYLRIKNNKPTVKWKITKNEMSSE